MNPGEIDPFKLMDEAYRLFREARAWSRGGPVDETTAQWLMTAEAWDFFRAEVERDTYSMAVRPGMRRLMGIPIRLTCDDDPNTPLIQLVMEPRIEPRFSAGRLGR